MKTVNSIPPFIAESIKEDVRKRCEDSGHVCPYWVDREIMEDLHKLDKKDEGNRSERYWIQCHSPEMIYRPDLGNVEVGCRRNNWALGEYFGSQCKYQNSKVAEEFKKYFCES